MGFIDPRTLGELLIRLIPKGNIGYWFTDDGDVVVVVRDREMAIEMMEHINLMRVLMDDEPIDDT